ncbi:glycosyltransferase family 9 protein [Thermodesulfovibrio sp. 3907-1M]|uniref:Glycosyltransferase family 9 protein n=1 Tax=Thermodesulfovibrio autotrophicus TaxID=3118333 RepID=A0AAU8GYW5_9BACT
MKILILPLYGIGDTLMTTPAIETLKRSIDCRIVNICMFKTTCEVLKKNPFIDELVYFPFLEQGLWNSLKFIFSLGKFDCAINFYPSNRKQYNILSFLTRAKIRLGHRYLKRDLSELNFLKNRTLKENPDLHNVEENLRILELLGIKTDNTPEMKIYLDEKEIEQGKAFVNASSKKTFKVGIHTGTSSFKGHRQRRWQKEKFLELINSLPDVDFFLFGTIEEKQENKFILKNAKHGNVILVENKPIREVASIIAHLNAFVSNDSGLMHLAAAVKVPVVAIFGPTNPKWVYPWVVEHRIVRVNLNCSPCFYYSPEPLRCESGLDFKCLKDIDASIVKSALESLIKS